ncbi:polysaccharide export protein [Desulfobacter hydrogenophilus]|uniref:Polysaccharide export protein n=1 Tax=Desulfobacter hydrogenophilus TaxID=2291 RepID=A0A328FAW4_9BACT|nr:polysaccharide biosynthesis/export family protein [Desulfobacter hydrogenophilus]NDY72430.1 polysaccharide export protein [Desulfobacter hydrogenophilus]QBH13754.1 polysaccharide export protein [Desulfobacter hydrogenophilus]RAM01698.1 polysaccharide export protein [Desulfobacter hydrogenophilus]
MFKINSIKCFFCSFFILLAVYFYLAENVVAANSTESSTDGDYKIGVGDVLQVTTWKEEDLTFENVFVRNDGKITIPLLDDIQAEGRTTMQLKKIIETGLADFVEAPTVTVVLANPGSQKYYILGEVVGVGEYPLIKKLTVVQAFALAKGFSEWASKDEILLYRKENGKEQMIKIDYDDITDGELGNDVQLKADDIIIVP